MTRSLQSVTPELARTLGVSEFTLRSRYRALVKKGLLLSKPGRGPGSGVAATPHNIAILTAAHLWASSFAEIVEMFARWEQEAGK